MNINEILKWFKKAVPEPTTKKAVIQSAVSWEETAERASAMGEDDLFNKLHEIAEENKSDTLEMQIYFEYMTDEQKIELLDSMCDEIVTRIGEAYMLGFDIEGALDEVNRSNWSKFENGSPVFDENGKIKKGASYFKPDLSRFIDTSK